MADDHSGRPPSPVRPRAPRRKSAGSTASARQKRIPISGAPLRDSESSGLLSSTRSTARPGSARDPRLDEEAASQPGGRIGPEPRLYDELVDYGDPLRDLDRLVWRNPRTAVLVAISFGAVIGFGLGIFAARE